MKFKKIISSGLALGLIFNNISVSLAGVISEDGRYETFEGNNIAIDNLLEEDKIDIEIEGNSLINIIRNTTWKIHSEGSIAYMDVDWSLLKPNTVYTYVVLNLNPKIISTKGYLGPNFIKDYGYDISKPCLATTVTDLKSVTGIKQPHLYADKSNPLIQEDMKDIKLIMIEGDYTDKNINFFEGLQSSFEENVNNKGEYELEILSNNKNLINTKEIYPNGVDVSAPHVDRVGVDIKVKPNTEYSFLMNGSNHYWFADINKNKISSGLFDVLDGSYEKWFTVVTPSNCEYIRVGFLKKTNESTSYNTDISRVMCVKGKPIINYMPHKSNKIKIPLSEPLRGLPNGIKDRIIKRNGQWIAERNLKEINIDSSLDMRLHHNGNGFLSIYVDNVLDKQIINNFKDFISTNNRVGFNSAWIYDNWSKSYDIALNNKSNYSNGLEIIALKSVVGDDLDSFKEYLDNIGGIKIVLSETVRYEPINIYSTINTYLDTTHISNNSIIPASIKVTVDRVANRATEAIQLAKENPTIGNISKARMWINLLDESILKDNLNSQIDNIVDIEDLYIEPKKVSGNIDIYVKSDNMLSMSLSTNSITFDSFTGIDDMELDNALNITVNSSLPYRLNSYLLSDLQNADGSVTMNRELLNIKMNNDTDYKVFTNLNEKVVLEDDCDSGNNNHHIIDFKLNGNNAHKADIYKAIIKFEVEQK